LQGPRGGGNPLRRRCGTSATTKSSNEGSTHRRLSGMQAKTWQAQMTRDNRGRRTYKAARPHGQEPPLLNWDGDVNDYCDEKTSWEKFDQLRWLVWRFLIAFSIHGYLNLARDVRAHGAVENGSSCRGAASMRCVTTFYSALHSCKAFISEVQATCGRNGEYF